MENKTAEESAKELGKQKAEKIYPVVTTHNWYQKENAAYRNGFEDGHTYASLQCADLRKERGELLGVLQNLMLTYEQHGSLLHFDVNIARQAIKKATE